MSNIFEGVGKLIGFGKTSAVFENKKDDSSVIKLMTVVGRQLLSPFHSTQDQLYYIHKYVKDTQASKNDKSLNDLFVKIYDVQRDDSRIKVVMEKISPLSDMTMREQYKHIPKITTLLDLLNKNHICYGDFHLGNIGLDKNGKMKLYDIDYVKFLDVSQIEPKEVFQEIPDFIKFAKNVFSKHNVMCDDQRKVWGRIMSVYLVDNTKKLDSMNIKLYKHLNWRLKEYYDPSKRLKRVFWDVPLSRFCFYKLLDGVDSNLIFKVFTTMTNEEGFALLKKFEPKMVMLDEPVQDNI